MAKFNVTGMEAVIKDMNRLGQQSGSVAREMLEAAADVAVAGILEFARQAVHVEDFRQLLCILVPVVALNGHD